MQLPCCILPYLNATRRQLASFIGRKLEAAFLKMVSETYRSSPELSPAKEPTGFAVQHEHVALRELHPRDHQSPASQRQSLR